MIGIPNILRTFTGWDDRTASYPILVVIVTGYYICNCAFLGAVWSTLAFAIDRYCALCHPMWHRQWTATHRRRIVAAITIGVVLVNIPRLISYEITTSFDGSHSIHSRKFRFPEIMSIVRALISVLFISGMPTLILIGLGISISIKLRSHSAAMKQRIGDPQERRARKYHCGAGFSLRNNAANGRQTNLRSNVVSLCIVINSLIFHSIPVFVDIHEALIELELVESLSMLCVHTINILVDVGNLLVVMNTMCCFIVYLCDGGFRTGLVNVLMCRKEHRFGRNFNTDDEGITVGQVIRRKNPILGK